MALHRTQSAFRAAAVAAAITGASLLGAWPATAQQTKGSPACAKEAANYDSNPGSKTFKAGIRCELRESDRRIDGHNRRGAEADKRAKDADKKSEQSVAVKACADFLLAGIKEGKIARDEVMKDAGGKVTETNACPVATKFGYGRRAEAPALNVR